MFLSWIRVYVLQPQITLCWVQYCIAAIDREDFTMLTTKHCGTAIDHGEIVIMSIDQDAQRSWDQDALIEAEIKIPYGAEIMIIVLVHNLKKILCWISVSYLRGDRAVATALCTGLIKAPQISSYGERIGKWCEEWDQDRRGTIGSEAKKQDWRQHFEGKKRGCDGVKGELWCYCYVIYFIW